MAMIDWATIARLNELRHTKVISDLAEEVVELQNGVMAFSANVPWISQATGLGVSDLGVESGDDAIDYSDDLDRVYAFYRERHVVPRVEISTLVPESLLALLGSRGYTTVHYENVLALDLEGGAPREPHEPLDGLKIVRTDPDDPVMLRRHAELAAGWFATAGEPVTEEMVATTAEAVRHPMSMGFMAVVGDEPVGVCGMEVQEIEGVRLAALWGAAVAPEHRRHGIQLAFLQQRLDVAVEKECSLALIESKPGVATERNAARVGFQVAYVRTIMELRGPGATG